jgi:hypothetical protein
LTGTPLLRLELRASRILAGALLLLHALAAACIAVVLPGVWGATLAALVAALGVATAWDRALLRSARSVRFVELYAGGLAVLGLADGSRLEGPVAARRNVSPWWVTLPFEGRTRRTLPVARDMLSAGDFRRLRIWALWGRVPGVAAPQPVA